MPRDMRNDWWFKFEHLQWLTDEQLNRCSLETQGFWIRCICVMHKSGSAILQGTGSELCRLLSVTGGELRRCMAELRETKAADVTLCHASVTQKSANFTIMSRKLKRELTTREQNRLRKQKERSHANVTDDSRDRVKSKSKEIDKEEEKEVVAEAAPSRKKGTRIPDTFFLTAEMRTWGTENRPEVDLALETKKFCNHFRSAPGQKGVKLNWRMTWENWILNARGTNGTHQQRSADNGRATSTDRLQEYGEVLDQYPTEAELGNIA